MTYEEIVAYIKDCLKKADTEDTENHIAVEFNIYGEGEGAFYIEINDGTVNVEPYEYYDRDAKVILSSEELLKIVKGEKSPIESFTEDSLMVEGDINAAQELLKLFKPAVKKSSVRKTASKKSVATKTVKAEKKIVEQTKKKNSKIAKDITK